jgi:amino acid permease
MSGQPPLFLTRPHLFVVIFFAIFILLLYQMTGLLAPFSSSLLWAAIIALALAPLYHRVEIGTETYRAKHCATEGMAAGHRQSSTGQAEGPVFVIPRCAW